MPSKRIEELTKRNFYDELMALRDQQRAARQDSIIIVNGDDLPWEQNRQGKMRWYCHPMLADTVTQSQTWYVQEIPPGGRTGKQLTQGGYIGYIWKGTGYTTINDNRYEWEAGDVVQIPILVEGSKVQHVNTDPFAAARIIFVEPNTVHSLGVDRGCGFEQLEDAPDAE